LGQGEPLSPILFNLAVDMISILIARANKDGQIAGFVPHVVGDLLSTLQYADDMIIFMDHNTQEA
jgi:hypothetical protein